MRQKQQNLAANFPQLTASLSQIAGGPPDLHIGVVSTDTGAAAGVPSCDAAGRDGMLLTSGDGTCDAISVSFLSQSYTAIGLASNFTGPLDDVFACMSQLGIAGCGSESPLDAARKAVDPSLGHNLGFLRDDALLLIAFLTDEDDCSTSDRGIFGNLDATIDDPFGPFSSFRCFDFGIRCNPDAPRTFGDKQECEPREDSEYLTPIDEFVTFFEELKGPGRFLTMSIQGIPEPSATGTGFNATVIDDSNGAPKLGSVCVSSAGDAVPAIRLSSFVSSFPESRISSVCNEDVGLRDVSPSVEAALSLKCLPAQSARPTCSAISATPDGSSGPVAECGQTRLNATSICPTARCAEGQRFAIVLLPVKHHG